MQGVIECKGRQIAGAAKYIENGYFKYKILIFCAQKP
jgi:hypothetical protein